MEEGRWSEDFFTPVQIILTLKRILRLTDSSSKKRIAVIAEKLNEVWLPLFETQLEIPVAIFGFPAACRLNSSAS